MDFITYKVLISEVRLEGHYQDFLEMLLFSHTIIQSIENKDGQYVFELMAFDSPSFNNVHFNKTEGIPRWKSFGFTVKEVA